MFMLPHQSSGTFSYKTSIFKIKYDVFVQAKMKWTVFLVLAIAVAASPPSSPKSHDETGLNSEF